MAVTKVADRQVTESIDLTTEVVGVLPVANGGTNTNTLTLNNVLLGNGTGAPQTIAPGISGNVLTSNGTTWISSTPTGGSTGTGLTALESYAEVRYTSGNYTNYGNHVPIAVASAGIIYFEFVVPSYYSSLTGVEISGISSSTGTLNMSIATSNGTSGDAYTANGGSLSTTIAGVTNQIWFKDISTAFAGLVPGQVVGVQLTSGTSFLFILGLRFRYQGSITASSSTPQRPTAGFTVAANTQVVFFTNIDMAAANGDLIINGLLQGVH